MAVDFENMRAWYVVQTYSGGFNGCTKLKEVIFTDSEYFYYLNTHSH